MTIPKLVAIDLDGTLLDSMGNISAAQLAACRRASQHAVIVVATGRRPRTARELVGSFDFPFHLISCSGAQTESLPAMNVLKREFIPQHHLEYAVSTYLGNGLSPVLFSMESELGDIIVIRGKSISPFLSNYLEKNSNNIRAWHEAETPLPPGIHFMTTIADEETLEHTQASLHGKHPGLFNTHLIRNITIPGAALDLLPAHVSKWRAISALADTLGISKDQIAAIGDDMNDRDMLENAGIAVAMGNSRQEIRSIAHHVTRSNNEDGVAWALENILGLC